MSLQLYHDSGASTPIDSDNPDTIHKAVNTGGTITDETKIYLKSTDDTLTYENVTLDSYNDEDSASASGEVDVEYAHDDDGSPGTYQDTLSIADGDYISAKVIWRKVTVPDVQTPFNRTDIDHRITADKYKKV